MRRINFTNNKTEEEEEEEAKVMRAIERTIEKKKRARVNEMEWEKLIIVNDDKLFVALYSSYSRWYCVLSFSIYRTKLSYFES